MYEEIEFGEYKLIKKLAASASSEIFLGIPQSGSMSGKPVVVKRLLPEIARTGIFNDLLSNEARLGGLINHPNIVKIFEYGSVQDELYLAMEYVDGLDLWRFMRRMRKVNKYILEIQGLYITAEVLKALQYLHGLRDESGSAIGIVHHDVSPSNILISRIGEVKLGDFGIAFAQHKELPDSEKKIRFRGKVHYISPEQIKGQSADPRSDIFAVGVVMAELLTGKKPFEGPTDLSVLINIKDGRSRIFTDSLQSIPKPLATIMRRSLANNPDERYQRAGEMLSAIEQHAGSEKLFDAGLRLGEMINALIREGDMTPAPRPAPMFVAPRAVGRGPSAFEVPEIGDAASILPVEGILDTGEIMSEPTPIHPVKEYLVKKADGQILGTLPMSAIIESIIADRIREDDLVAIGGKPFQPVSVLPEFAKHLPSVTPTARIHTIGQPDRRGIVCQEESVARTFYGFYRKKDTGLMIFECASVRKEIYIEEGSPSYASSNLAGELLGEFLVKKGFINRMELELALAMMDRFSGHLGDTLIGLDILDSITLLNAITEQIKARIFDIYTWETGAFSFFKNAKYMKEGFRLAADPLELIRDGYVLAAKDEEIEAWFEDHATGLFQLTENVSVIDDWKIEVPHRSILAQLEKPQVLREVIEMGTMLDDKGVGRLKKLIRFGIELGFVKEVK
jgi:hypothetical protein